MKKTEKQAISYLNLFAMLLLVAVILAFIPFGSIVTFILGIVSLVLLLLAFRYLSSADERFKIPYIFVLIELIGTILIFAGFFGILGSAFLFAGSVSNLIGSAVGLGVLFSAPTFFGSMIVIVLGAVLSFIGFIVGTLLGLYRVGKRYNDSKISIGAILLIFPLVDIAGLVLIIIGLLKLGKSSA